MYQYTSNEEVAKYVTWNAHKSPKDTKAICKIWVKEYTSNNKYHWAIVFENKVIGTIEILEIIDNTAFAGWVIDSTYWNMGIMTECASAVRDYMFGEIGIEKLNAAYVKENIGSGRVMQKIGMKQISPDKYYETIKDTNEHRLELKGKPIDFYSITLDEWKSIKAKSF